MDGFTVLTPLTDAFAPEHYERAEAAGITGMKRFRKDLRLDD